MNVESESTVDRLDRPSTYFNKAAVRDPILITFLYPALFRLLAPFVVYSCDLRKLTNRFPRREKNLKRHNREKDKDGASNKEDPLKESTTLYVGNLYVRTPYYPFGCWFYALSGSSDRNARFLFPFSPFSSQLLLLAFFCGLDLLFFLMKGRKKHGVLFSDEAMKSHDVERGVQDWL